MARSEEVIVIDDLDGSKAVQTVRFGLDGKSYEIDLSAKNARALDRALAPYVAAARKVRKARSKRSG